MNAPTHDEITGWLVSGICEHRIIERPYTDPLPGEVRLRDRLTGTNYHIAGNRLTIDGGAWVTLGARRTANVMDALRKVSE